MMTPSEIGSARPSRARVCFRLFHGLLVATALAASLELRAQSAPAVSSVTPANGATGIGSTTPIVFVFDQAMDTSVEPFPSIPPFVVGNIDVQPSSVGSQVYGTWSDDGLTLTLTPATSLPLNVTVTWKLNPAGAILPFKSESGVPLATVSGSFTTGAAAPGPQLLSATPADGATGVAVNSAVVFVFDRAMKTNTAIGGAPPSVPGAVLWAGTGVDGAKFSYAWSSDATSLTCSYAGDLPANTMVTWLLNAPAAPIKVESAAGQALAGGASGRFTTASGVPGCNPSGLPDSWGTYTVFKNWVYEQTSAAAPHAATTEDPYLFSALVRAPQSAPSVSAGSLTTPDSALHALTAFGGIAQFFETPATETAFDTAYGPGSYTLRFTLSGQSEKVIPMTMTAATLPVPTIVNFDAAQAVDATADFTLQWNGIPAATTEEHLSMYIADGTGKTVFQAPDLCLPRELPVSAKSIVIPANTLLPGRTYTASLAFGHIFYQSTNAVPEMSGFGDLIRDTRFTIKTGSGGNPAVAARFTGYRVLPNGNPELTLTGTAERAYTIQRSSSVAGSAWQGVGTATMNASGSAVFEDTQSGKVFPLFYRAVAN